MRRRLIPLLVVMVFILIALNSTRYFSRIDITASQANSISAVSRELARSITDPISITYYISDKLRARATEPDQVIDILEEYAAFSRGAISVQIIDPVSENLVTEIEELGVLPQQIQVVERDQQSYATVYTGIVIRYLERNQVLPLVFSPGSIEYQLSSSIKQIMTNKARVVGLLAADPTQVATSSFNYLENQLTNDFEFRRLERGQPIDQDVSVLLVLPDESFDNDDVFAIDQYLMAGKAALFAMNGYEVRVNTDYWQVFPLGPSTTLVHDLLQSYGIEIENNLLLDVRNQRIPVVQVASGLRFQGLLPYPHWLSIFDTVNLEHPITARFSGLDLFWPSSLTITDPTGVEQILASSNESWIMTGDQPAVKPDEQYLFEIDADKTRGSYPIGVVKTGPLTHYAALRVPETSDPDAVLQSTDSARMIVISDRDFLSDIIQVTGSAYNLEFATNLVDWLGNDEDLLSIRSRATRNTRLNRIQDPELAYSLKQTVQWIATLGIPLVVVVIGIWQFIRRRRHTRRVL